MLSADVSLDDFIIVVKTKLIKDEVRLSFQRTFRMLHPAPVSAAISLATFLIWTLSPMYYCSSTAIYCFAVEEKKNGKTRRMF